MSFDDTVESLSDSAFSLNPFGTGQCLSTGGFEELAKLEESQSLWNRAMSFDPRKW